MVRDSLGFVLLAAVKPMVRDFSSEVAESMVVLFGLQVAIELGFKDLEVETDAANVMHLVHGSSVPLSDRSLVYSFVHIHCSANRVAHPLAKLTLSVDQQIIWLEDYPSCVESSVTSDFPYNL
ncbi:hypothetical protein ACOSQ2_007366 [Xanthoceras sorbifolium]